MQISVNGECVEATADNAYFYRYDNDLLNGVYVDIGQRYLFISQHHPSYEQVEELGRTEGFREISYGSPNLDDPPHTWILGNLGKLVIMEAEGVLGDD